ncbi:MAG: DNA mismatch repair endonuclease MutL [Clostridiales bacterium]|nr:DNA mismatch repair endonuclease MutL [Clostridiales bacterium]
MPRINVLPGHVAQLIAAGEVVERPASVMKELIENAIDAGATVITVEIQNGGTTYIRVTDNGCGIEREDIPKVFLSHATSKLAREEDLGAIATLGFRGEAMASIASVARVELLTCPQGADLGTRYVIEGGEETACDEAGCPRGTTVVVRDLFYNTPARMKFLKKDVTEGNAVASVVERVALSHAEISFRFVRDGKQVLLTPGDGKLKNTVYAVCGAAFAKSLLPVEYELDQIRVTGFISHPQNCRSNRSMQYFFINSRLVQSRTCMAAIEQSYKNSVMVGKFPACILNLELDVRMVDVNVHPAKTEVRFTNDKPVFNAVYYACKNALQGDDSRKEAHLPQPPEAKEQHIRVEGALRPSADKPYPNRPVSGDQQSLGVAAPSGTQTVMPQVRSDSIRKILDEIEREKQTPRDRRLDVVYEDDTGAQDKDAPPLAGTGVAQGTESGDSASVEPPEFRYIGEAFSTYIILELEKELYFIDKHAAHERILFEQLKREGVQGTQTFLAPEPVRLSTAEYDILVRNLDLLRAAGFEAEDFGSNTILVRACPTLLKQADMADIMGEVAGKLLEGKTDVTPERLDWIYCSMSCRGAVKAGDKNSDYELELFARQLLSMPDIKYCPHGRPILFKLGRGEIEKQFGRI